MNSAQKFLLNVALPGVAVLGGAIAAYMLTGGEEEFEQTNQPDSLVEDSALNSDREGPPSAVERIESQLKLLQAKVDDLEKSKPDWVSELHELAFSIATDVKALKESSTSSSSSSSSKATDSSSEARPASKPDASPPPPPRPSQVERLLRLCGSVFAFAQALPAEAEVDARDVLAAAKGEDTESKEPFSPGVVAGCDVLLMFVRNLVRYPDQPRYRRVALSNPSFQNMLAPCVGHGKVMEALCFEKRIAAWEFEGFAEAEQQTEALALLKAAQRLLEACKEGNEALKAAMKEILGSS